MMNESIYLYQSDDYFFGGERSCASFCYVSERFSFNISFTNINIGKHWNL